LHSERNAVIFFAYSWPKAWLRGQGKSWNWAEHFVLSWKIGEPRPGTGAWDKLKKENTVILAC